MITTPNMSLTAWTSVSDAYNHTQLATNWGLVDTHDHSAGKGVQLNAANSIQAGTITAALFSGAIDWTTAIGTGTITGSNIASDTITASNIANATITGSKIAANTIEGSNIDPATTITVAGVTVTGTGTALLVDHNAQVSGNLAVSGTITGSYTPGAGSITGTMIASGTITSGNIASGTITGSNIAAGTITGSNIGAGQIGATEIATGTITTTQIASGTIVGGNINSSTTITCATLDVTNVALNVAGGGSINVAAGGLVLGSNSADNVQFGTGFFQVELGGGPAVDFSLSSSGGGSIDITCGGTWNASAGSYQMSVATGGSGTYIGLVPGGGGDYGVWMDGQYCMVGPSHARIGVAGLDVISCGGTGLNPTLGFYGNTPVVQAAHPTTLADVITVLTNLGLTA